VKLLLSLHDVTPRHMARLVKAEQLFVAAGVERVTYLFVPDYHGACPAEASPAFVAWCRAPRRFDVQWFLHGHYHADRVGSGPPPAVGWGGRLARAWLTAGEAEFLGLSNGALSDRLERGMGSFRRCFGSAPVGFVPPAWLHNDELMPALRTRGFQYSENHARVFQLQTGRECWAPVVTWATRTVVRKYGSLVVAPVIARGARRHPIVRVAVHPYDMDHRATTRSVLSVLAAARRGRTWAAYDDTLFD
jgi:predicted deacetylase